MLGLVADIPNHPDAERREYAAIVLRRMPAAAAGDFTARWLAGETSWNVKRELYMTIELQGHDAQEVASPEVLRLAKKDLAQKPGPITRKALIRLLGRALRASEDDELGIEDALLAMIPHEVEQKSDLYTLIAEYVDPKKQAEMRTSIRPSDVAGTPTPQTPQALQAPTISSPGATPGVAITPGNQPTGLP